ncbi:tripartite ATP-independent transporter solute receptor, DctP family [Halanaerobium congolense]|jgi:tripartite ATP-independent transporter DctP family solute receptor|uniref:Tripartite ATP-independent transporter DctP family solute receptor n=1 Tax=Halanaerobium congolense TaxID=54121 RepID=A0A1G6T2T4_9FIRM|nr:MULTISPECIES: DctP family TRAP transporter solute-binding subunit [Halanaerobium]PTX17318.1 tripartite ATP-independent transporter DctP family solute receptor [Halanaerobium congolense]PUU87509.1 MAG: TRAP dicarboxylate transporter subunit DctP [Halanaerobium sp.]TDX45440.1 tripartite ATP-independent transporter DctP family solute receptor [Halanaerobium congolense]SDD23164.1 tripartite ATP-independent transporter solute receptor, DctP family [Halanaerobium congolense]SDG21515.1 tripartite 
MRKKLSVLLVVLFVLLSVGVVSAAEYTIKVGNTQPMGHIYNQGLLRFKELVEDRSNGEIEVQIFPSSQLGDERDLVEGLQLGTVQMALSSTGPLGGFVTEIMVLDLPYLFKNRAHAYSVLDGEIGQELSKGFVDAGIRNLGYWENGWRNITNSVRPIYEPEDLNGIKIRVMESKLMLASLEAMGASPLPMAFSEVYTALEQGTIDAQENPLAVIYSNNFAEVQEYLSMTQHFYNPALLLISESFYSSLPEDYKEIVRKSASEAKEYERYLSILADERLLGKLQEEGMEVNSVDKDAFVEATKSVYDENAKMIGEGDKEAGLELMNKIQNYDY